MMKRLLASLASAAMLAAGLFPLSGCAASAQTRSAMSVRVVSPTHQITITATHGATISVRVKGIRLDSQHIGKGRIAGHGHLQVYLDRLPSDGYKKADLTNLVAIVGSPKFTLQVSKSWTRIHRGHHRLIIALAQNNNVLYHASTASIRIAVR